MLVHARLLYTRFAQAFAKSPADGSSEKLFDAGEMGMIRNLIDIENLPDGDDEKKKTVENEEDAVKEYIAEEPDKAKPEEETAEERVVPEKSERKEIKNIPADEIFSKLNAKEEAVAEEPAAQQQELTIELPPPPAKSETDKTFLELEKAAQEIEEKARLESEAKPESNIPFNEEANLEDAKMERLESEIAKVENELLEEKEAEEKELKEEKKASPKYKSPVVNSIFADFDEDLEPEKSETENVSFAGNSETTALTKTEDKAAQVDFEPESRAETFRKSGMAYSAAIVLLGAVIFMMLIGWGADLLFGSSPWGIVIGIVVGAIIGFVQFFRVTSQIFKK